MGLALLAACQPPAGQEHMPATAWTEAPVQVPDDGELRVLVIHDMEGLSGQSDPSSVDYGTDL